MILYSVLVEATPNRDVRIRIMSDTNKAKSYPLTGSSLTQAHKNAVCQYLLEVHGRVVGMSGIGTDDSWTWATSTVNLIGE